MDAAIASAESREDATSAPQLRTLLLTDLVDSTGLVERLGDTPAAALFREHDALVLQLQQRWRGRLIDRSDGLLLLFERAIDGLGFALDYARGLRELGRSRDIALQARAGLHVGEVLTWRNSDASVQLGAKPLEVEGLAKPLAGRLMTLARPGQILLSATAEPLARRAARELGERGEQLIWKSHGRWRLKGVPEPQELVEVGEPGLAPLRAPKPTAKAWRDIPLWRRPAALAAELVLLAGLATGAWFLTRPQPAIAFGERDWVVMGDLRNLTGQPVLDDSLQQAFRISLEQSRFVNVLSDLKSRDTLARMQREPGTALDRAVASEIALRDGARAVILPTVAEVGGRVRVSAEVIDPHSQTTVYSEFADGKGLDSVLASVDEVTAGLRARLGEEIKAIERDSKPLPQVSTSNLDALRAYALGVQAQVRGEAEEAINYYERAVREDPGFALAYMGLARVYSANDQEERALHHARLARMNRAKLTTREQGYVEAWMSTFGPVRDTLQQWKLMSELYPDYFSAYYNFALFSQLRANDSRGALQVIDPVTSDKNPFRGWGYSLRATLHVDQGNHQAADSDFRIANRLGAVGLGFTQAGGLAARRRFDEAARFLSRQANTHKLETNTDAHLLRIVLPLDRGDLDSAASQAESAMAAAGDAGGQESNKFAVIQQTVHYLDAGKASPAALQQVIRSESERLSGPVTAEHAQAAYLVAAAAYLGGRAGEVPVLDAGLAKVDELRAVGYPLVDDLAVLLAAEKAQHDGNPRRTAELLSSLIDGKEPYQVRVAWLHALMAQERYAEALQQARWLVANRGRAYVEFNGHYVLQALNVADSNSARLYEVLALRKLGRSAEARKALAGYDGLWGREGPPRYLMDLRDRVAP